MKVYIAGPMRGLPQFPAFDTLAADLRGRGWDVANPAEHDREVIGREALESAPGYAKGDIGTWSTSTGFDFHAAMRWDLAQVLERDAIVLLPGWENSTGARYERMVAEAAGKQVWLAEPAPKGYTRPFLVYPDPSQRCLKVVFDAEAALRPAAA
jgi:hypothetical protein